MTATITPEPAGPGPALPRQEFAHLAQRVRDAGLMGKRPGYYSIKISATAAALIALAAMGVLLASSWWIIAVALGIAFTLAQLSFIAHDAGHRQVSRDRRWNHLIGLLISNLCAGFSFTWWLDKHNRHHAHTNQPGRDPDLEPGALAYTRDQVEARRGLPRWFARIQVVPPGAAPLPGGHQPPRGQHRPPDPPARPEHHRGGRADGRPRRRSSSWRRSCSWACGRRSPSSW